uniref:Uncharacterized protein n=1 Tax=Candidatus Kentrum sp. LFY TaxID=2126342 RepID=A0A450U7W1_9GAMM|nr:MAG: hypothetical protein BECKLFY1418B_GA0070995_100825 [Candidatus Kentron sp. LFY]
MDVIAENINIGSEILRVLQCTDFQVSRPTLHFYIGDPQSGNGLGNEGGNQGGNFGNVLLISRSSIR